MDLELAKRQLKVLIEHIESLKAKQAISTRTVTTVPLEGVADQVLDEMQAGNLVQGELEQG